MHTVSAKLTFQISHSASIKDKRQVRRSIIDKVKHRFNVSIAEVDTQDAIQTLTIGIAIVSGELFHARQSLDEIVRYMEDHVDGELVELEEK